MSQTNAYQSEYQIFINTVKLYRKLRPLTRVILQFATSAFGFTDNFLFILYLWQPPVFTRSFITLSSSLLISLTKFNIHLIHFVAHLYQKLVLHFPSTRIRLYKFTHIPTHLSCPCTSLDRPQGF